MKPMDGMLKEQNRYSKTNGPKAFLLVSSKNLLAASEAGAKENFGIRSFHPKIRGHVLTPKFQSICGTLGFRDLLRKAKMSIELVS